jgi:hypothetical protein
MNGSVLVAALAALLASLPSISAAGADGSHALQSTVSDGPVKVTARIDKGTVRIAEPIQLVLEVEAPRGTRLELPAKMNRLGVFDVRLIEQSNDIPSATGADKRTWILRVTLESIKTGALEVPPLDVHYTTDAKSPTFKTLSTSPIPVHVTSVVENRADPTRFRDIKPTVDVPVPQTPSRGRVIWTCGGIAAAFAGLLLITAVVRRRRRGLSPAAWAIDTIKELEQLDISETGAEGLFNEVVDVLREYFELEFNVPTLPKTTREFLADASSEIGLPEIARKRLEWIASVADEIKFARLAVGEQHLVHAFTQARAFVAECDAHRLATTKGAA